MPAGSSSCRARSRFARLASMIVIARVRAEAAQHDRRARKQTTANDRNRADSCRTVDQHGAQRACVHLDHETLQHTGPQNEPLEPVQPAGIQPAERRRPSALAGADVTMVGQARPVHARPRVMLDVIPVVEEQQVVARGRSDSSCRDGARRSREEHTGADRPGTREVGACEERGRAQAIAVHSVSTAAIWIARSGDRRMCGRMCAWCAR